MIDQRVPLRQRRDLGQIIEATLQLYTRNAALLFGIAATVIPVGLAAAVFQAALDDNASLATIVIALGVLQLAVNILAGAALIAALADIDAGRPADFSSAYDVAFQRFWTVLGAILRATFHVLLFAITIIGIPWAIQRAVRWLFIEQAVILDGSQSAAALSRSADGVIGRWWRTFGISTVIWLIGAVPASLIGGLLLLAPVLVSGTINAIVNAVLLPFAVTAITLLYCDLQLRKESDDIVSAA